MAQKKKKDVDRVKRIASSKTASGAMRVNTQAKAAAAIKERRKKAGPFKNRQGDAVRAVVRAGKAVVRAVTGEKKKKK